MTDTTYTSPVDAADVTEEILGLAREASDEGWFPDGRVEWEAVWDRIDGARLSDGSTLDLGSDLDSPALRKIQRVLRAERREA